MNTRHLCVFLLCVFASTITLAQVTLSLGNTNLHAGKIGLGIDGITGSPNLLLKYFFNNQVAGQIIAGFEVHSPGGNAPTGQTKVTGTTFRGGFSLLYHLTQDQVSPYIGVEGVFQTAKAAGFYVLKPDPKNSIIGGAVFGAEYFFNEKFTLGIKQSLGLDLQLKRDIPKEARDITFNTATLVTGRFYFN